jgi:hypothetical protein
VLESGKPILPTFRIPKRGLVVLCLALSCCALTTGAKAQPLADVAADQELFAAHCLGATRALADRPTLISEIGDLGPEAADAEKQTKEILSRHMSRFRGYLAARGLLSGSRSSSQPP